MIFEKRQRKFCYSSSAALSQFTVKISIANCFFFTLTGNKFIKPYFCFSLQLARHCRRRSVAATFFRSPRQSFHRRLDQAWTSRDHLQGRHWSKVMSCVAEERRCNMRRPDWRRPSCRMTTRGYCVRSLKPKKWRWRSSKNQTTSLKISFSTPKKIYLRIFRSIFQTPR